MTSRACVLTRAAQENRATAPHIARHAANSTDRSNQALQAKLRIGPQDDPLEREADRAADRLLAGEFVGPLRLVTCQPQRKSSTREPDGEDAIQLKGTACEAEEQEIVRRQSDEEFEEDGALRFKTEVGGSLATPPDAAATAVTAVAISGEPLSPELRAYFEPRFAADFSTVRIHTDSRASAAAIGVNARAFTSGHDIFFARDQYSPSTLQGRRLLAHELAHVEQQSRRAAHSSATRRPTAVSTRRTDIAQRQALPNPPATKGQRAASHAETLLNQRNPRIWFDSWANDNRDNNNNGKVDDEDPHERKFDGHDGLHWNNGGVCRRPDCGQGATISLGPLEKHVPPYGVMYKVCVDIVVESYRAAGVDLGTRSVAALEAICQRRRDFRTWREDRGEAYPELQPGDIITYKTNGHSHSGIVGPGGSIIHLPGPSNWLYSNRFSDNDMESTWQISWRLFFGITQVSRPRR